ncbi:MAG: MarR family transcriptional regulator [Dehalococcoidia bacterium]|nr:MarR family transcriptional regulator [Dehalococcoidia bacterium]
MTELKTLASRYNSLAVHLTRRLRRTDAETGVGSARLSALSVLVFGGSCTLSQLAAAEQVTAPTMSRIVAGLEREGLVSREQNPEDRRSATIRATMEGRVLMERARQRRIDQLAMRLAKLDPEQIAGLEAAAGILEQLETIDER